MPSVDGSAHRTLGVLQLQTPESLLLCRADNIVMEFLLQGKSSIEERDKFRRIKSHSNKYDLRLGEVHTKATLTKESRLIRARDRRLEIIESCHRHSGHYGIRRIESLPSKQYAWANMKTDIKDAINN